MLLLEQFRHDIERAIAEFAQQNSPISPIRSQNIAAIRELLQGNNPLKVCSRVTDYVNRLSSGFVAFWSFLEVNRLKNALLSVLVLPMYQENAILKKMISEMGVHLPHDGTKHMSSDNILVRIDRLESSLNLQNQHVANLQLEVKRLKVENQVLTKTITALVGKNKELTLECQKLKEDKAKVQAEGDQLTQKYNQLMKENAQLKKKIFSTQPPFDSKEEQVPSNGVLSSVTVNTTTKDSVKSKLSAHCDAEFFMNSSHKEEEKSSIKENILVGRRIRSLMY